VGDACASRMTTDDGSPGSGEDLWGVEAALIDVLLTCTGGADLLAISPEWIAQVT